MTKKNIDAKREKKSLSGCFVIGVDFLPFFPARLVDVIRTFQDFSVFYFL